jgi:methylmalonyl-CoA mutase cobalamin-binding subunit
MSAITASTTYAPHRHRRTVVALAGPEDVAQADARQLTTSLAEIGIEAIYLGWQASAGTIAAAVAREDADTVELFLPPTGGVRVLRDLLRELIVNGRRGVSVVVHRTDRHPL